VVHAVLARGGEAELLGARGLVAATILSSTPAGSASISI